MISIKSNWIFTASLVIFGIIFSGLVLGGHDNLSRLIQLHGVKGRLLQETTQLVEENKALQSERNALHHADHVEKVARESLGLVKSDETIYVVEERPSVPASSRQ